MNVDAWDASVKVGETKGLRMMETLRQMAIRDGRVNGKVRSVILAAPDLDVDVFATQWRGIGEPRPQLTVFVSRNDAALRASRRLAGDVARLGQIDPMGEPYHSALANSGIDVIDLGDVRSADRLNHSTFAGNPEVVQRIGRRLIAGETFSGSGERLGERVGGFATGAGLALTSLEASSAPLTIDKALLPLAENLVEKARVVVHHHHHRPSVVVHHRHHGHHHHHRRHVCWWHGGRRVCGWR